MKLITALIIIFIGFFSVTYATTLTGSAITNADEHVEVTDLSQQTLSSREGSRLTSDISPTLTQIQSLQPNQYQEASFETFFSHLNEQEREALRRLIEQYKDMTPDQAFQARINQLDPQQRDMGVFE